jgi:hypothetical protein
MQPQDYTPLDLQPYCNAGLAVLDGSPPAPVGAQGFHGLPFQIGAGSDGDPCFLVLGGDERGARTVGVGQPATHVIFAHRLLDSRLRNPASAGATPSWTVQTETEPVPIGEPVAEYVVRYAGGGEARLPVRERFEIAVVPTPWGQAPFLAWPDANDYLLPRYEGPWSKAGGRQTEAAGGAPLGYYLWAWANPQTERAIEAIEIVPAGPRFLLAAITLSHLDEPPFRRGGRREVKVTLPQPGDADRPFDLEAVVDRGVATYPYALPTAPAAGFLGDGMRGWGEEQNPRNSPAYLEVAATPSATLTVRSGGEELGSVRWGDLEARGAVEPTTRLRLELIDRGRNWVRTTVVDDATGRPLPCRVHFRSPDGVPYAPHGHHAHVNSNLDTWHIDVGGDVRLGQISYAYIDGTCEGWLPRGEVLVDVARGFEYEPLRARVTIEPGQQRLELRLKRWIDMNGRRYFSGDSHVHFLSSQGAVTEARGEDLNVVNLLLSQWGSLFTNTEEFTGGPLSSRDGRTIVYATQENRQHLLGHLTLLGLKEPVMPWCSDGLSEAEIGGTLETTLSAWADACHAQGGTVVIPHLPAPNGEPAALIATGRADAVEMLRHGLYEHLEYYRYLNAGYRLPLVGGTDKMSSQVPVGLYRTYVYIPPDEEFSYEAWCRNLRLGRTFLSGGPLIHLTVDGHHAGDTIALPGTGGTVEIEAWAESTLPLHTLQIVQQGRVVASTERAEGARRLELRERLTIDGHTWLAARCGGPGYLQAVPHHDAWGRGIMAHTSPIYVAVGEPWRLFDAPTAGYMLTLLHGGIDYIRQRSPQYRPGSVTHHHGEEDHLAFLERPFQEAIEALHRRLHEHGIAH